MLYTDVSMFIVQVESSTTCSVFTVMNLTNSLEKLKDHLQSGSSTKDKHLKEAMKILDHMYDICHRNRTPNKELEKRYQRFFLVSIGQHF